MRRARRPDPANPRSGAALLLSVLVLIVVITIVFQIRVTTMTGARVTRNDVGLTTMELAIEAAKLEVFEQLKADAEAAESAGGEGAGGLPGAIGGAGADPAAAGGPGGPAGSEAGGAGSDQPPASDSREDEWARPQRPEVNRIQLRVLVVDEDRKFNLLNLLNADEERAEEAFQRAVRILDACRDGTEWDIDTVRAEEMVRGAREYMLERDRLDVPKPELLTADPEREGIFLPFTLREFLTLEPFLETDFRDFRDEDGAIVHSIEAFLTIWTSPGVRSDLPGAEVGANVPPGTQPQTGGGGAAPGGQAGGADDAGGQSGADLLDPGASGQDPSAEGGGAQDTQAGQAGAAPQDDDPGGYAVNLNTAPPAVLKSLLDTRDVSSRFWDDVIDYRNEEEERDPAEEEDAEKIYDEFGEEIVPRKVFDSLDELNEVQTFGDYDPDTQQLIRSMLTTESRVFSIYITARRTTTGDEDFGGLMNGEDLAREEEQAGNALVRTVRVVIWRRPGTDATEIVALVPWEYVDYAPFELSDFPEDERDFRR